MNKLAIKTPKPPKLSPQRKRFADALLTGSNQTQSAVTAGYTPRSASVQADRLLKNDSIQAYIAFHELQIAERNRITQDEIVSGIREVIINLKVIRPYQSVPLLKGYELLAKMGGYLREQGMDPEQRPAFVGINITMGKGKIEVTHGGGNSGGITKMSKPVKTDIIDVT